MKIPTVDKYEDIPAGYCPLADYYVRKGPQASTHGKLCRACRSQEMLSLRHRSRWYVHRETADAFVARCQQDAERAFDFGPTAKSTASALDKLEEIRVLLGIIADRLLQA